MKGRGFSCTRVEKGNDLFRAEIDDCDMAGKEGEGSVIRCSFSNSRHSGRKKCRNPLRTIHSWKCGRRTFCVSTILHIDINGNDSEAIDTNRFCWERFIYKLYFLNYFFKTLIILSILISFENERRNQLSLINCEVNGLIFLDFQIASWNKIRKIINNKYLW